MDTLCTTLLLAPVSVDACFMTHQTVEQTTEIFHPLLNKVLCMLRLLEDHTMTSRFLWCQVLTVDTIGGWCDLLMITRGLTYLFIFISSHTGCGSYLKILQWSAFLDFSQSMQKINRIGFRNSILILRVMITTNSTQVDKFLNLPNSTLPSYTTTTREPVQSSRVMPKIFKSPHTPS